MQASTRKIMPQTKLKRHSRPESLINNQDQRYNILKYAGNIPIHIEITSIENIYQKKKTNDKFHKQIIKKTVTANYYINGLSLDVTQIV